jgi:hypothetical protein
MDAYRAVGRPVHWQPVPAEPPTDGEVVALHLFWDDPVPIRTPEELREIDEENAHGEEIDVADILREYGVDVLRGS